MIVEATYNHKDKDDNPLIDFDTGKQKTSSYQVDYGFGENLVGLLKVCGAEDLVASLSTKEQNTLEELATSPAGMKIYYNARGRIVVALQGSIRNWLAEGLTDTEIDAKVQAWDIPEGAPRAKDPVAKAAAMLANLSDDEVKRLLDERGL